MRFIPNNGPVRQAMLAEAGFSTLDDLFASIPEEARLKQELRIPPGLAEEEQLALFKGQLAETEYDLLIAEQAQISFKERFVECRGRLEARGAELIGREATLPTSTPGTLEAAEPIPWDESDTFRW